VPLRLEGPTRTIARRSGPVPVTLYGDRHTWCERDGLVLLV
jgi:hypothetical protein